MGAPYEAQVTLEIGGADVSKFALFTECTFTSSVKTQVGSFSVALVGTGGDDYLGKEIRLSIDGAYYFGGVVTRVTQGYVFPATTPGKLIIEGADYAVYFDRMVAWNKMEPTAPLKSYGPDAVPENVIINEMLAAYFLPPSGFGTMGVTSQAGVDSGSQVWVPLRPGETLRALLSLCSRVTQSVWFMDPYFQLHVQERYSDNSSYGLSDQVGNEGDGNLIGFRTLSAVEDISQMVNEALVWGNETEPVIMSHIRNNESIAKYGRFQVGEWSQQMYKSESVTGYAKTFVNRLSRPLTFFTARAFRPGIYPGEVISVSSAGSAGEYVAKQVTIGFITSTQPYFDIALGIHPEDPWKSFDVVPFLTKPLEKIKVGTLYGSPFDFGTYDQPHMPVIETWGRHAGTVLSLPSLGVGRIEYIEEYHWEPGLDFQVQAHTGYMMNTCAGPAGGSLNTGGQPSSNICGCAAGLGPDNGWFGNDCCSPGSNVHYNAPYSRIPREYPENKVTLGYSIAGWGFSAVYYSGAQDCFCFDYGHVYATWNDCRQVTYYSPLVPPDQGWGSGGPNSMWEGTPGTARIKFSYRPPAPGIVYAGFPISLDGDVPCTWWTNPNSLPLGVRQVSDLKFEVRHIEAPAGTLALPYEVLENGGQEMEWVWNYPSVVVAEFDLQVPEWDWDDNGTAKWPTKYVTAEIAYPDVTKDHAWILVCKTPRVHNYGGQLGPCSWGYRYPPNVAHPEMHPFPPADEGILHDHGLYHRGYEITYGMCLFGYVFPINFPPMVAVEGTLTIETNAHGNLFAEDYPTVRTWDPSLGEWYDAPNPLWDGVVDMGWGSEDAIEDIDGWNTPTGWYKTTWPFQNDSLQIFGKSGIAIDRKHYVIDEPEEGGPSPWPRRYKLTGTSLVPEWVRYNSRPLKLISHQGGDSHHAG
jgi:hypothetical protein